MTCGCGHPRHHHAAGGVCTTITVAGPPVPKQYWGAAAELHIGRTLAYCDCSSYTPPEDVPCAPAQQIGANQPTHTQKATP